MENFQNMTAIFLANYEKKKFIKTRLLNNLDFINKHIKKLNKKNLFLQKKLKSLGFQKFAFILKIIRFLH